MDPSSFENIRRAVKEQHFKDRRLEALKSSLSCAYGYLSGEQVALLITEFTFADAKMDALRVCAPRLYSITCSQAASVLRAFDFKDHRMKALEAMSPHITDNDLSALDSALKFADEKSRAREILMNRPQPGFPPQPGPYPGAGSPAPGFPGMPAPQPEAYPPFGGMGPPVANPYAYPEPGAVPPPYPTGTAPPPPPGGLGAVVGGVLSGLFGPHHPPHGNHPYPPPR